MKRSDYTILIVEDETTLSLPLSDTLRKEGCDVVVAKDGEAGLALALQGEADLILLDLNLPKMDGLTLLRQLRAANAWGKAVPVIILTNLTSHDEKRMIDVTELEPTYYLEKVDWQIGDVVEKVKEILRIAK